MESYAARILARLGPRLRYLYARFAGHAAASRLIRACNFRVLFITARQSNRKNALPGPILLGRSWIARAVLPGTRPKSDTGLFPVQTLLWFVRLYSPASIQALLPVRIRCTLPAGRKLHCLAR